MTVGIVVAMAVVMTEMIVAPLGAIVAIGAFGWGSSRDRSGNHEDRHSQSRCRRGCSAGVTVVEGVMAVVIVIATIVAATGAQRSQ
jgi:hypothetical protein